MTAERNGQPTTYKLDMSGAVISKIKEILNHAKLKGFESAAIRALRIIIARVRIDPLEFGELYATHKSLNLVVHVAVVHPVVVYFAIHSDQKLVFIQRVFLINSGPDK
jgi:hypothetical protein